MDNKCSKCSTSLTYGDGSVIAFNSSSHQMVMYCPRCANGNWAEPEVLNRQVRNAIADAFAVRDGNIASNLIGASINLPRQLGDGGYRVIAYDWDCTLSTMPRRNVRRRDGLDHSDWVAPNVRRLILELYQRGATQAIVSYADSRTILESLRGAGLDTAIPAELVLTPDYFDFEAAEGRWSWMRRDEDGRPLKSDMMRWLMKLMGDDPNVAAGTNNRDQRRRYVLVDDLPRNIEDVTAAGFDAIQVPDERYTNGADGHNECGGVAKMLNK